MLANGIMFDASIDQSDIQRKALALAGPAMWAECGMHRNRDVMGVVNNRLLPIMILEGLPALLDQQLLWSPHS